MRSMSLSIYAKNTTFKVVHEKLNRNRERLQTTVTHSRIEHDEK